MKTTALNAQVGQIGQNTKKKNCLSSRSVIHIIYNVPVGMMKRGERNIVGGILLTTKSYILINNMFNTT